VLPKRLPYAIKTLGCSLTICNHLSYLIQFISYQLLSIQKFFTEIQKLLSFFSLRTRYTNCHLLAN
jgi:hypothetical protein